MIMPFERYEGNPPSLAEIKAGMRRAFWAASLAGIVPAIVLAAALLAAIFL